MAFLKKHKMFIAGLLVGYIISRQAGARIEAQLKQATTSLTPAK